MKKSIVCFVLFLSFAAHASNFLTEGTLDGKMGMFFKKKCSMDIELVEKTSQMLGKYKEYEITARMKNENIKFLGSLSSAEIAIESGELGTANGSDTSGTILTVELDPEGTPLSYKVIEHLTLFGFSRNKTIINCKNLQN